jgi:hypothetical protein
MRLILVVGLAGRHREGSSNNRVKSGYEHGRSEAVPNMVSGVAHKMLVELRDPVR